MKKYLNRALVIKIVLAFVMINVILIIIGAFFNLNKGHALNDITPTNDILLSHNTNGVQTVSLEGNSDNSLLETNKDYTKGMVHHFNYDTLTINFDSTMSKAYLAFDYSCLSNQVQDTTIDITLNGDSPELYKNIVLPNSWAPESTEQNFDIYNNEVVPISKNIKVFQYRYIFDQEYYGKTPILFNLEQYNTLTIKSTSCEFLLGNIYLVSPSSKTYTDYKSTLKNDTKDELITIEGESPYIKSTPEIRPESVNNPGMYPYSTKKNYLNCISGDSFNESGYSITYLFDVSESGNYNISLKYYISQTFTSVYSKIYLDNEILFDKMNGYEFKATKKFINETLHDKNGDFLYYLTKGTHSITFQLDSSAQAPIRKEIMSIIGEMNDLNLEIIKLTNGVNDKNKFWDLDEYIPDAKDRLISFRDRLKSLVDLSKDVSQSDPKVQNRLSQQLENAYKKMKDIAADPNELPHKLNLFTDGSNSISSILSSTLHTSTFSPLSIDRIYISSPNVGLPSSGSNFFIKYFSMVQRLFSMKVNEDNPKDTINIWVNRSTYYVALMQQYADAYYTKETGQKIRFSLLPDESKIIYANASDAVPDAAFGVAGNTPFSLGMRGALANMKDFTGFGDVSGYFSPGAFTNLSVNDAVYGLPETQDFQVTFYRKDLISNLGINVPTTYDEIVKILPSLQRYGMNYYIPLAGATGLKAITSTAPFIYQYGGRLYSDDYMSTALDEPNAIKAINEMVDLFVIYSLPLTSQSFYNSFRDGSVPIGVSGFSDYLQIKEAAPEIVGKWGISNAPGVIQEDGSINFTNSGIGKNIVIFKKSKKQQKTFDFISWWMSTDTQSNFARDIQATYGSTFLWNTANVEAFKTLAIPESDKAVILKQWEQLYQVPQTPASYMVERGLSDIWNSAVFDHSAIRSNISDMTIIMDKEIERKMQEFGYMDDSGTPIKKYTIPSIEEIKSWSNGGNK